ncbi:acyltransferase-like protein At1g54570, chloroplastic [Herrania umbratica]|uniref:Acyltransferase-like protein At1g54570, chloroplastic n=1 Tax=Herrania umbratica TaxID=108875 RepID=A0A6J1A756_9ROSI|nr:acyltransferase-like protein At1g54570, chloroplastic [Herrania umbratica]
MASAVTFRVSPCFGTNPKLKPHLRVRAERLGGGDLSVLSSDGVSVNGAGSVIGEKEKKGSLIDGGNGRLKPKVEKKLVKEMVSEELEVLWDDGYGTNTVKDYLDAAKDMIKPDGGPPRWFCPVECGRPVKGSPVLLFLPGLDGVGIGLILHHKALGKVFEVQCLHVPVYDRTPFEGLVKLVEETVRLEHASRPNSPIYLVGDSFGGCLALAVAARNPTIDLVVILVNPATSFGRSQLQPLLPILKAFPHELHVTIPYILSLVMGEPLKMATVGVEGRLPPTQKIEQLSDNLTSLLPRLSGLADIIPKETLVWKLKLLKSASAYANSRLHAVKAEVLVLASDKDNMLPSREEAHRLKNLLPNCEIRCFKDNGHTLLLEDSLNLLTVIKGTSKYRRSRRHDYISDFLPPSMSEYRYAFGEVAGLIRFASCSAMFSTMEDGKIVQGLAGVPNEGPVLFVGYHMLMGLELSCLIEAFLREKNIMLRGIAHPELFWGKLRSSGNEFAFPDWVKVMGALPVTANYLFRALSTKSHVLLYPGGAREALHYKGEQYKLFWPNQPEFVRMAARFGATIVPFGTVGEDDIAELVLDYHDLMNIPGVSDFINKARQDAIKIRDETKGEVANQELFIPGMLPKVPGRFYYLFGKPIKLKGREDLLENREDANELYLQVKSEVEQCISYLLKKREEDPYRSIIDRTIYRALYSPLDQVPSFEP